MAPRGVYYSRWTSATTGKPTTIASYPCSVCGQPTEGCVMPRYEMGGTPDYCYKHYRERRLWFAFELLMLGDLTKE